MASESNGRGLRILAVGNSYPAAPHGGYELVWKGAMDHLEAHGHEVRVLVTDVRTHDGPADQRGVRRTLRWHLVNGEFEQPGPLARLRLARHNLHELARAIDEHRPDVVTWWSMGGLSLAMLEEVRRRGIPAVAFVHDEWLDYGRWADRWLQIFTGPRRRLLAPFAARASGIPASVDFGAAAHYAFRQRVHPTARRRTRPRLEETSVLHSGISADYLDPAPTRQWDWNLLYVGASTIARGSTPRSRRSHTCQSAPD